MSITSISDWCFAHYTVGVLVMSSNWPCHRSYITAHLISSSLFISNTCSVSARLEFLPSCPSQWRMRNPIGRSLSLFLFCEFSIWFLGASSGRLPCVWQADYKKVMSLSGEFQKPAAGIPECVRVQASVHLFVNEMLTHICRRDVWIIRSTRKAQQTISVMLAQASFCSLLFFQWKIFGEMSLVFIWWRLVIGVLRNIFVCVVRKK